MISNATMVPRQSESYVRYRAFMIAWNPMGSTLGDNEQPKEVILP